MRARKTPIIAPLATSLLAILTPAWAAACAVCGGGPDRERVAFLISTGFLSLLPLALIFGGLLWLRRRAMRDEFIDRDDLRARARTEIVPAPEPTAPRLAAGEQPARG